MNTKQVLNASMQQFKCSIDDINMSEDDTSSLVLKAQLKVKNL